MSAGPLAEPATRPACGRASSGTSTGDAVASDPSSGEPSPRDRSSRDPFFDVVRSVALLRVVAWHAVAAAWLSWFLAAMPLMFFTAGAMLARSSAHRRPLALLRARTRRVLVPLWALGAAVAVTSLVEAARDDRAVPWASASVGVLRWLVPLTDPPAPEWLGGWLTSHLWYLRAYLWMVLLAPLVLWAARRVRWSCATLLAGAVVVELARRGAWPLLGSGPLRIAAGDVTCYGLFAVLGAASSLPGGAPAGRPVAAEGPAVAAAAAPPGGAGAAPGRSRLVVLAGVLGVASALVAALVGLPTGVANDSYPVLILLGGGWLAAALAARGPIVRLGRTGAVRRAVAVLNRRAVTIYLWHPVAIVVSMAVLPGDGAAVLVARLLLVGAGTAVAVLAFGWVEDVAAGRAATRVPRRPATARSGTLARSAPTRGGRLAPRPRPVPARLRLGGVAVAALAAVATVLPAQLASPGGRRSAAALPPPSDRAALEDSSFSGPSTTRFVAGEVDVDADRLQTALDDYAAARRDQFGGVQVAVLSGGALWAGESQPDGGLDSDLALGPDDGFEALSITKLFTGALVLQLADEGRIALDQPVPPLPGVVAPKAAITPRMLLQHASGLENYPDVVGFRPGHVYTPAEAVSLSTRAPLRSVPGSAVWYSNSNYLWLGLLLEQVSGQPYAELVAQRLVQPLGLEHTGVTVEPRPGWAGHSSGAVASTATDLLRFSSALFEEGRVLRPERLEEMTDVDRLNVGLGAWPMCPCGTGAGGTKEYAGIGHTNAWGGVYYYPADHVSLFVRLDPPPPDITPAFDEVATTVLAALHAGNAS